MDKLICYQCNREIPDEGFGCKHYWCKDCVEGKIKVALEAQARDARWQVAVKAMGELAVRPATNAGYEMMEDAFSAMRTGTLEALEKALATP